MFHHILKLIKLNSYQAIGEFEEVVKMRFDVINFVCGPGEFYQNFIKC